MAEIKKIIFLDLWEKVTTYPSAAIFNFQLLHFYVKRRGCNIHYARWLKKIVENGLTIYLSNSEGKDPTTNKSFQKQAFKKKLNYPFLIET